MNNISMVADLHEEFQVEDSGVTITMDNKYPHIPVTSAFMQMFLGLMFFLMLNKAVIKYAGTESVDAVWKNIFVSWIHALIIGPVTLHCLLAYPEIFEDSVYYQNTLIHSIVCFSTAYFYYDFYDIWMYQKLSKEWPVLLHHVLLCAGLTHHLCRNVCLGYTMVVLVVEINSIFLHGRKLLQLNKVSYEAPIYVCIKYLNLITFVLARFWPLFLILRATILAWEEFPILAGHIVLWPVSLVAVINVGLFMKLLKSDLFRKKGKKGSKPEALNNNNTHCKHK